MIFLLDFPETCFPYDLDIHLRELGIILGFQQVIVQTRRAEEGLGHAIIQIIV